MNRKLVNWVRKSFNRFGYELIKLPRRNSAGAYGLVTPYATYSPWEKDMAFQQTYKRIQPHTLVDQYRCYELWQLAAQSAKLNEGSLIEIGVWRGGTGALIAQSAGNAGITDKVYLCDTFKGVVKAGEKDPVYKAENMGMLRAKSSKNWCAPWA